MKRPVVFRSQAGLTYSKEFLWYEAQREGLGLEFELCIEAALELVCRNPSLGLIVTKSIRRLLVKRFPFGLYYVAYKDHIEVIGLRHFRRRPISKHRHA